jgi:glucose-6-phosphate 1-dehydrogenase
MNQKYLILILGASGDLAQKKLLPACFELFKKNQNFIVIGAAIDTTDAASILRKAEQYVNHDNADMWARFACHFFYKQLDFAKLADYTALAHEIKSYEKEFKLSPNRLIYLAAASDFYCAITTNLALSGIAQRQVDNTIFQRIVYEKPFGWDTESAGKINNCIKKYFNEEQIYRVDHYLTKSLVNSIALIRFANSLFEPLWNNNFIDHVQIVLSEKISVGKRFQFYDKYGALKDVVQNHMLQLLALIGMEKPIDLSGEKVSAAKIEVLKHTRITDGLYGQYTGYTPDTIQSKTETFAQLELAIDTPRWHQVPFYLKTGKNLDHKSTEIHVVFKPISKQLFNAQGFFEPNILSIRISSNSGFSVQLNAQKSGAVDNVSTVKMDFCYNCLFGELPHAYEILITEILNGDRSIAVDPQEIEYAWHIIDSVKLLQLPLYSYTPGSNGPIQAEEFNQRKNIRWVI